LNFLKKNEPKIQRLRKFSKNYKRRFLDFSKLEKPLFDVLHSSNFDEVGGAMMKTNYSI
jgi:hypothetical protein